MTISLKSLEAFLEERTPGCEAYVIRDACEYGVTASIYISEQEIRRNVGAALDRMPYIDWAAFVRRTRRAVGPYAPRAGMRKAAGL